MIDLCCTPGCMHGAMAGHSHCGWCQDKAAAKKSELDAQITEPTPLEKAGAVRTEEHMEKMKAISGKIEAAMLEDPMYPRMERRGVGPSSTTQPGSMSAKYPKYYKAIPQGWTEIDVYGVCKLFPVKDDTGCIHHALKKLLVPGVRTGGKSFYDDIKEARDTLSRWMELNPQ